MIGWRPGVLIDWQLIELCEAEKPLIAPYRVAQINPASIDLRLGNEFLDLRTGGRYQVTTFTLNPGDAILACTLEYVSIPVWCSATVFLKSSAARLGLDHALAGWIDPGFHGQLTLELHAHRSIILEAGKCYMQMVMQKNSAIPHYDYQVTGRYNGQTGPTKAK